MTDDLDMKALSGDVPGRAAAAIAAGCDIALNCWGRMDDMIGIAKTLDPIGETARRSEEHTSELQSLMRISYAVFCLKKKNKAKSQKKKGATSRIIATKRKKIE